jgi:hypothetical protein
MSMDNYGGMILTGKTPHSSTRSVWQYCPQSYLAAKQENMAKDMIDLAL